MVVKFTNHNAGSRQSYPEQATHMYLSKPSRIFFYTEPQNMVLVSPFHSPHTHSAPRNFFGGDLSLQGFFSTVFGLSRGLELR